MEQEKIILVSRRSDREQIIELGTTLIGLVVFAYTLDPDPFDRIIDKAKTRVNGWLYRFSVWEAILSIRSLPETDES